MKVTEAIKKALKEHPEVKPCAYHVFNEIKMEACSIGLAVIGNLGLEAVQHKPFSAYRLFNNLYPKIDSGEIERINDRTLRKTNDFNKVLNKLEKLGY